MLDAREFDNGLRVALRGWSTLKAHLRLPRRVQALRDVANCRPAATPRGFAATGLHTERQAAIGNDDNSRMLLKPPQNIRMPSNG